MSRSVREKHLSMEKRSYKGINWRQTSEGKAVQRGGQKGKIQGSVKRERDRSGGCFHRAMLSWKKKEEPRKVS